MISQRDFNDATSRKRNDMARRLRPKYWRKGKRAGKLRTPGFELPFSLAEFRDWAMREIGFQCVRCFYCPTPIDVLHFEPDHATPLALNGSPGLDNLVPACKDCNRIKGGMRAGAFIRLMRLLEDEDEIDPESAADVRKRLRTGAMAIRLQEQLRAQAAGAAEAGGASPLPRKPLQSARQMKLATGGRNDDDF